VFHDFLYSLTGTTQSIRDYLILRIEIEALPVKDNRLEPSEIRRRLGHSLFASNIVFHETLDSTNRLAKDLGRQGAPEGTLVLAEGQSSGRGRMGRTWFSPRHANLLFSLLVRPTMGIEEIFILTMVLALAAIDAVKTVSGVSPMIKWPNDLYVEDKKLGGILTEFSVKGGNVSYVVLGMGLNVRWNPGEENGILYPATSILAETGARVSREELLVGILKQFENAYLRVSVGDVGDFCERWNRRSMLIGKSVALNTTDGSVFGRALRIDHNGALIILDEHGKERKIVCGDVSVRT